ncbi:MULTISPECIES: MptD family putative ECF transporter S component [Saccharibacillus]|uniref:MptD family putative ECF transporter S component n=1 Tax=Saccharibacillus TaxID=456492 RepID=UPI00123C0FF5|nr:MptD family putative ECF transporter S component [Saccharibacillus sp. WB 17]MWJ32019.1 hypothetical protein [Saccharibacillus sp. WB 17]
MQKAADLNAGRTALLTRDYILIGVFSILIYIVNAVVGMAAMPFLGLTAMPLIAGVCLLFSTVVYQVMAIKIGKRGVLLLFAIVTGLFYLLMGVPFMLPFMACAGIVGELALLGGGKAAYRSFIRQAGAFGAYGVVYGMGSFVMIYVYSGAALADMFAPDTLALMVGFARSPVWMIGSMAFSFVMVLLGSVLGRRLLRKHFMKSGLIR